ncbi:MAG: phenylacetate--CoA ligase family protein, partial [Colwellia sp.]
RKQPILFQSLFISIRALVRKLIRETKQTKALIKQLERNEKNDCFLKKYSESQLDSTLKGAIINTSFYSGNQPNITAFDFITKATLQKEAHQFLNVKYHGPVVKGSTSGTTGSPLSIPQNIESVLREQAFISRYLKWAGFKEGDRRAWIRGDVIVPIEQKQAPFWRYSYFEDMIMLSSFHMSFDVLPQYIQAMVDYNVDIIQALPSSIVTLAKYLESKNEYYPATLKSIITSSESLSKDDKKLVEKRFKCTVFDWYGLFERVAAIGSCEHGRYHILTDYSHVELLPVGEVDGKARAEVIGTNFNNSLYPLIRYKTGDHVILSDDKVCPCGRVYPVIDSIEGRTVEFLIATDDTPVYSLSRCSKDIKGLLGCQYIQDKKGSLSVMVIPSPLFTDKEKQKIIKNIKNRLGDSMQVEIVITDNLLRSKSGKVRQAICTIEDK